MARPIGSNSGFIFTGQLVLKKSQKKDSKKARQPVPASLLIVCNHSIAKQCLLSQAGTGRYFGSFTSVIPYHQTVQGMQPLWKYSLCYYRHTSALLSRPLKSPFLRDIVQVQYLAYFLKHAQKSFHSSFEVICCCREKYVHSISYHTLIKVAAQTIIRL